MIIMRGRVYRHERHAGYFMVMERNATEVRISSVFTVYETRYSIAEFKKKFHEFDGSHLSPIVMGRFDRERIRLWNKITA